jgi:hypothetical protein
LDARVSRNATRSINAIQTPRAIPATASPAMRIQAIRRTASTPPNLDTSLFLAALRGCRSHASRPSRTEAESSLGVQARPDSRGPTRRWVSSRACEDPAARRGYSPLRIPAGIPAPPPAGWRGWGGFGSGLGPSPAGHGHGLERSRGSFLLCWRMLADDGSAAASRRSRPGATRQQETGGGRWGVG